MLKTKVGYSENPDAYLSGKETAKTSNLSEAKVGFLFTSCVMDQKKIVEGIRSEANAHVLGCTSSAAIYTQDGVLNKETGYSGIFSLGGDVQIGVAGSEKTDEPAREIGRKLAKEAMKTIYVKRPDYFFVVASPKEEEEYIKGVQDIIGEVPVFGGSAADNTVEGKWSIICDDKVFSDGCAICLIATDSEIKNIYTGEFNETKDAGIITKVKDNRTLVEIDGESALDKYLSWTGFNKKDIMGGNLLAASVFDPIGVKDPIGKVTAVRHPMGANEDGSLSIGANLVTNTAAVHLHLEPEEMIEANVKAINELNSLMNSEANSYFLVHCGGRRLGLSIKGKEDEIFPAIKKAIPDKEFLVVFTFGEYGTHEHSGNTVGGLSLSFTGFGR